MDTIRIKGARQHNLKNITLRLPKNRLIVFTGVSGSGKSSMAFDTIYAEGQRRYVESLSSYARQFLGIMDKPDVDSIEGLSPAISIDQKSTTHNPRSTVGTVTEIYDYLRLLFARIGHPHCPNCGREISKMSAAQIVDRILVLAAHELEGKKLFRFLVLSPVVRDRKGEFEGLFDNLKAKGFRQVRVDQHFLDLDDDILLIKTNKHTIDVVVDRLSVDKSILRDQIARATFKSRLTDAVEQSLSLSQGLVEVAQVEDVGFSIPDKPKKVTGHLFSEKFACPACNIAIPEIEPRSFSFNSPHGACPRCSGIGSILSVDPSLILSPELSITEGGILPFAKMFLHDTWYARVVLHVARAYGIDERKELRKLTDTQRNVLLHGSGGRVYEVQGKNRFGEMTVIHETYGGIIPELMRRYRETQSDFMRMEIEKYMREEQCPDCRGARLKPESLTVTITGQSITKVTDLSISDAVAWIKALIRSANPAVASNQEITIATPIVKEITARFQFLIDVGLDYLTMSRGARTLSGGEAQRIRLASQIGSGLSGVLYVLDEPSIGLHQRDNKKLIETLKHLRELGNTVIVVEHDREMMEESDHIVDFGPGAGEHGGRVVAEGSVAAIKQTKTSLTGQYLSGKRKIVRRAEFSEQELIRFQPARNILATEEAPRRLVLSGATEHNLKDISVSFPLGKFICVTGVSGSGKSTLVVETLYEALERHFNPFSKHNPGKFTKITGLEAIDKAILIDQSPIGRTPRSNPATYTGIFSHIREIFAEMPQSKVRGYTTGRFSFNVKGGRCEACEGEGQKRIEMQFLSDVYVKCEVCGGTRYNSETLEVTYRGKTIAEVLDLTIEESVEFFAHHPALSDKLKTIQDVGLGYMHLGQPATTLSGGEAQRVKLATELSRRATGRTLYVLDEPTTGLHFADLEKLLHVLHRLTSVGNTVVVIEHNLDIIRNADWIIDMGPDGGDKGGSIIAVGTPSEVARQKSSYTGAFLQRELPSLHNTK